MDDPEAAMSAELWADTKAATKVDGSADELVDRRAAPWDETLVACSAVQMVD